MIYPKFLKPGHTIGVCAPSRGIDKEDQLFDIALSNIKKEGYKIFETPNVRTGLCPSASVDIRAKELNELIKSDDIDFVYCASGGDFLIETLPLLDEEAIREMIEKGNAKFVAGYSDPTSLLYYLTTKFDIATLYGTNAGSFDQDELHASLKNALRIIKGDIPTQESFEMYETISWEEKKERGSKGYLLNTKDEWKTPNGEVNIKGRIIGGCIDCLKSMVGTRFDYTKSFIERYKEDGIIWYFDNFALKSEDLYYVLWQMKEAGWFEYAKGFVFGRTLFKGSDGYLTYEEAVIRALGNEAPVIMEADIGHVKPTFSIINGAIANVKSSNGKGKIVLN